MELNTDQPNPRDVRSLASTTHKTLNHTSPDPPQSVSKHRYSGTAYLIFPILEEVCKLQVAFIVIRLLRLETRHGNFRKGTYSNPNTDTSAPVATDPTDFSNYTYNL